LWQHTLAEVDDTHDELAHGLLPAPSC
jgi:hypothetical protein